MSTSTIVNEDGSIILIRGDTCKIPIQIVEDDGITPVDITGVAFRATMRSKPNGYLITEFFFMDRDNADGKITPYIPPENTEIIRLTEAWWDLEVQWLDGTIETIVGPASVEIIKDISTN